MLPTSPTDWEISSGFSRNWFNGRGRGKQINPTFKNSAGGTPSQERKKKSPPSLTQPVNLSHAPPPACQEKSSAGENVRLPPPPQPATDAESRTREEARFTAKVSTIQYKLMHNNGSRAPDMSRGGAEGGPDGEATSREAETSAWEKRERGREEQTTSKTECEPVAQSALGSTRCEICTGSEQPAGADGNKIFFFSLLRRKYLITSKTLWGNIQKTRKRDCHPRRRFLGWGGGGVRRARVKWVTALKCFLKVSTH